MKEQSRPVRKGHGFYSYIYFSFIFFCCKARFFLALSRSGKAKCSCQKKM